MSTISSGTTLTTALVQTGDTTGNLVINTGSSNTTAMTVLGSNQNVGIGTSSPGARLGVSDGTVQLITSPFAAGLTGYLGTSTNHALAFVTNNTERGRFDTSGNFQFNSGYGSVATAYGCRAWVNFNGTGTVAIRGSGNVSSITDNGTGNYTVNFTTAMSDANYGVVSSGSFDNSTDGSSSSTVISSNNLTTSSVRIRTSGTANNLLDFLNVNTTIFR